MSDNGESTESAWAKRRTFGWYVRQVHFWVSMLAAVLILFYATTGFIASRSNLFNLDEGHPQHSEGTIPADVALDAPALAVWLSHDLPGRLREKSQLEDDRTIRFEMESVWSWHDVTVDRTTRHYTARTTPASWASTLIGLHRGKWASQGQRLVMDLTASSLALVILTGLYMALTHPLRSRRWAAASLLAVSLVLGILMCVCR